MSGAPHHPSTGPAQGRVIDLTISGPAAAGWLTASTGVDHVEMGPRPKGRRRAPEPSRAVPKGQKHAYLSGQSSTGCGLPLGELHAWDEPFGDGLLNRCPTCLELARGDLMAADASHR